MIKPPLIVTSAMARRNIEERANPVTQDQIRRSRLSAPGVTAPVPSTNDAGHASSVGNGVSVASFWMKFGYNVSGSIRPPSTNISFCQTQNTGEISSSQKASNPIPR